MIVQMLLGRFLQQPCAPWPVLFPTKSGIHPILGIDGAHEPPWKDSRRVAKKSSGQSNIVQNHIKNGPVIGPFFYRLRCEFTAPSMHPAESGSARLCRW